MKAKLNLSISRPVAEEAQRLGINMSRVAEAAIARTNKLERNRRWVEENRAALAAYTEEIGREGLPLGKHRLF